MPRSIYFFWRHMLPWSEADFAIVLQSTLPRCLIRCWALASLSIATQSKWYIPSNRICVYDHSNHMHMFTDMSSLLQSMWKMVSWLFSRYWEYTPSSATTNSFYLGRNDCCNFVTLKLSNFLTPQFLSLFRRTSWPQPTCSWPSCLPPFSWRSSEKMGMVMNISSHWFLDRICRGLNSSRNFALCENWRKNYTTLTLFIFQQCQHQQRLCQSWLQCKFPTGLS